MKIKEQPLNITESENIYEEVLKHKPIQLNQCYLNTFAVANLLKQDRDKSRKYKVAYGYMKVIDDKEEGYEDWQYKSFVRHAFIVDDKNKIVDISYIHLHKIHPQEAPTYIIMKKFSIHEYMEMVMEFMKGNPDKIDLTWENGVIKNEESFKESAKKAGYILL